MVIFRSSGSAALKTDMILYWTSLMDSGTLPEISVNTVHLQMEVKAGSSKKKPRVNTIQKQCCLLWTKAHLKCSEDKWKTDLWSDESKYEIIFGNHGYCVLQTKEERNHPAVISGQFNSCISDGLELH